MIVIDYEGRPGSRVGGGGGRPDNRSYPRPPYQNFSTIYPNLSKIGSTSFKNYPHSINFLR